MLSEPIQKYTFFHEYVVAFTRNTKNERLDCLKKNLGAPRCYVHVVILIVASKGLNKRVLEESGDGPTEKYRKVLDEAINLSSTNRGFRTVNHMIAIYEQTTNGLIFLTRKYKFRTTEYTQNL